MRYFPLVLGTGLGCWAIAGVIRDGLSWEVGFCFLAASGCIALAAWPEKEIERDPTVKPAPDYDKARFAAAVEHDSGRSTEDLRASYQRGMATGDYLPEVMDAMLHVLGERQRNEIRTEEGR